MTGFVLQRKKRSAEHAAVPAATEKPSPFELLSTEKILPNPGQPRRYFDGEALLSLSDSIRRYGILQPVSVTYESAADAYILVAGERRLRAAKLLGLPQVPAVILNADVQMSEELALIENIQREDLGMFEEARAIASLLTKYGMTQEAAQRALSERGLSLGSVDQVESDKPEGTVVWQSIDANSSVNQGTTVNIQISKRKKADEQKPDSSTTGGNTGSSEDDTPGKLPPTPAEGSATIPVALPDSADTAHVVIYVDGVIQYDDTPSTSQGSIAVTVQSTAGDHEVTVSVDVKNCGDRDGEEIVQLYIRDLYSSVTRPVMELKDFRRVKLSKGETKTVDFTLQASKLAFYNNDMDWVVEAGDYKIMVGGSSLEKDLLNINLNIE